MLPLDRYTETDKQTEKNETVRKKREREKKQTERDRARERDRDIETARQSENKKGNSSNDRIFFHGHTNIFFVIESIHLKNILYRFKNSCPIIIV